MRSTYFLKTPEGQTQDMKGKRPSDGHSLPGDRRGMDKSGQEINWPSDGHSQTTAERGTSQDMEKKATEQEALTN